MILLAAGALLASRAEAQGVGQPPPSDDSQQTWHEKDAQKARELGAKGESQMKKGAATTRDKVNEGGQALSAKIVGTKTVTGEVADVSADQVTVKKDDGTPMNLRLTPSTKVTIGGQKASRGSLQQGAEVRASYAQSGGEATAQKIDVTRTPSAGESTRTPSTGGKRSRSSGGSPAR
jgi:hypothetical protein